MICAIGSRESAPKINPAAVWESPKLEDLAEQAATKCPLPRPKNLSFVVEELHDGCDPAVLSRLLVRGELTWPESGSWEDFLATCANLSAGMHWSVRARRSPHNWTAQIQKVAPSPSSKPQPDDLFSAAAPTVSNRPHPSDLPGPGLASPSRLALVGLGVTLGVLGLLLIARPWFEPEAGPPAPIVTIKAPPDPHLPSPKGKGKPIEAKPAEAVTDSGGKDSLKAGPIPRTAGQWQSFTSAFTAWPFVVGGTICFLLGIVVGWGLKAICDAFMRWWRPAQSSTTRMD